MFGRKPIRELNEKIGKLEKLERKNTKLLRKIQNERQKDVRAEVQREFQRRDLWAQRKAEVQRLAAGRKIAVLKCAAPDSPRRERWGDWHYCLMLKENLERAGLFVIIDCYEDWYCDSGADLVIVMGGKFPYHPDRRNTKCRYVLWIVSHPDRIRDEQCEWYDEIWVDGLTYAAELRKRIRVPVRTRIVPVDTDLFCPAADSAKSKDEAGSGETPRCAAASDGASDPEAAPTPTPTPDAITYEHVFVGNPRDMKRNVMEWCEQNGIPLHVWGNGWEKYYPDPQYIILHGPAAYRDVPEIYRHARVILNDHLPDMLARGLVNNRILEVLACGKPLVSDGGTVYRDLFPYGVLYYEDEAGFLRCVRQAEENYEDLRRQVMAHLPAFQSKYAAAAWAETVRRELDGNNEPAGENGKR